MIDSGLARLLARTGAATAYPDTPALTARVLTALASAAPGPPSRRLAWASAAAALVALLALLAFAAAEEAGDAIARFFGIEGSSIERLPPPAEGVVSTPLPTPTGLEFLGKRTTLDAAAARLGFAPPLPPGVAQPNAVYDLDAFGNPVIVLEFASFDLWVARPGHDIVFAKGLPAGTALRDTTVNGRPARWISDGFHVLTFRDAGGQEAAGSRRTVGRNTLVWATDFAFYRLETDLAFENALEIARTLP